MSDTYQAVRDAIAAADDEWGEETGDGNANPDYLDQLAKAVDAKVRAVLAQARTERETAIRDCALVLLAQRDGVAEALDLPRDSDMATLVGAIAELRARLEEAQQFAIRQMQDRDHRSQLLRGMARRVAKWRAEFFENDEKVCERNTELRAQLAIAENDAHDLLCWKEDMLRELASSPHDRPMAKAARTMGRQRDDLRAAIESALTELRRGGQTDDIRRRSADAILGPLVESWRESE